MNDERPGETMDQVTLKPHGRSLRVIRGSALRNVLFEQGVEFPCGGRGRCRGCRVRVLEGDLAVTTDDARLLSERELSEGWRLACQATTRGDLVVDLAQWEETILADETPLEVHPREGYGVAIDVGTTTLAGQLLDLRTGRILAVRTALNAQARHGLDIMSRVEFAVHGGGQGELVRLIREQVGELVAGLIEDAGVAAAGVGDVVLVGNTVMHHLFGGLDLTPLSMHPFTADSPGLLVWDAKELAWNVGFGGDGRGGGVASGMQVSFLPVLGGFVGSDVLAGILATRMQEAESLEVLVDLGTNGEIVVGNRERLLVASTAAGPAFEGARIAQGMRAVTGAISEVTVQEGCLTCRVMGGGTARGVCGSGLVDAVAGALALGRVGRDGRLISGQALPLRDSVSLQQADLRELQLAKGAIAAGVQLLLRAWGAGIGDVARVWLAGAFGNSINRESARRIGLLPFPADRVRSVGNTALLGAKLALVQLPVERGEYGALRGVVEHVCLNEDPDFLDAYVEAMGFPEG